MFYFYMFTYFIGVCFQLSAMMPVSSVLSDIVVRPAQENDLMGLLELQSCAEQNGDSDKIVIVPKLFREESFKKSIHRKELFVAYRNQRIVGFKKLYPVLKANKCEDILKGELQVGTVPSVESNRYTDLVMSCPMHSKLRFKFDEQQDLLIYNGGDLTHPDMRGNNINGLLTTQSFAYIAPKISFSLNALAKQRILFSFGLTAFNAGESGGLDRTPSLLKRFDTFLRAIEDGRGKKNTSIVIDHYKYPAYMPTFDPNALECIPKTQEFSVSGYGNVFVYQLQND